MIAILRRPIVLFGLLLIAIVWVSWPYRPVVNETWNDDEIEALRALWIGSLQPLPPDPSNAVADSNVAARFGQALFFDRRMSANGGISCAHCHEPLRHFTDGLPKGQALGASRRNTMSIVAAAYSPWQYWDGRRDSLWAQALSPLTDPKEHGASREQIVRVIAADQDYRETYSSLFGAPPDLRSGKGIDRAFANVGKVIAAYERRLLPGPSAFDEYVAALLAGNAATDELLTAEEVAGLRLFIGDANCTQCHNGPLLTNHEFHNTGVLSFPGEVPDIGRAGGVREVVADPFNCHGAFSDDPERQCLELDYMRTGAELIGAFRTPSLRSLKNTAPYMHKGQIETLAEVLRHYNDAPPAMIGHNEAKPLGLNARELRHLEAFLHTLASDVALNADWLQAPDH
ncbi:MAG: cytochrome-c peroxidase [Gammaproteobacteria bacterium]|nr:cytochrome-c peroxidase [Gammaproteobacteria bacterium]